MKAKIRLDTMSEIKTFVDIVSTVKDKVYLTDEDGHCVSAKSIMGVLYSFEWNNIYCHCDKDISGLILKWIV